MREFQGKTLSLSNKLSGINHKIQYIDNTLKAILLIYEALYSYFDRVNKTEIRVNNQNFFNFLASPCIKKNKII